MYLQVFLGVLLLSIPFRCSEINDSDRKNEVLRDIVFVRTEGLGMVEFFFKYSQNSKIRTYSKKIITYYKTTQPILLDLCRGADLNLKEEEFNNLMNALKDSFQNINIDDETYFSTIVSTHLDKSILLYTRILQQAKWDDVSYFSFKALPELFNLKLELLNLKGQ